MRSILAATLVAAAAAATTPNALAQPLTTAFTYQGELTSGSTLASGPHDFIFLLYDGPASNVQVGPALCADNIDVTNGRFTVSLDFGAVFNGQSRSLEVRVRQDTGLDCSSNANFETLAPRTTLSAAPHAAFALSSATSTSATQLAGQPATFYTNANNLSAGFIPSARLSGFYTSPVTFNNAGNTFVGTGFGLTDLNASNITSGLLAPARGGTGANTTTATPNQVLKWSGSAWLPGNDLDTNTTYTAGAGLTLSGTTFSIPPNGINSGFLANPAVSGGAGGTIADGTINNTDLATDALALAKVSGGVLSSTSGAIVATGEVRATEFNFSSVQTSYVMVPAAAFSARDNAGLNKQLDANGVYPLTTASNGLIAPVNLPHGATITGVRLYAVDNSTTSDLTALFLVSNATAAAASTLTTVTTTGASTTTQTPTDASLSHVVNNSTSSYAVVVGGTTGWSTNSMILRAVRVEYLMGRPAR